MSTATTSPTPLTNPFRTAIRMTGTTDDGSLAPAPPATHGTGTTAALPGRAHRSHTAEFRHGATASTGR